jgi:uncharacterized membrane protein (UPF0136 family)
MNHKDASVLLLIYAALLIAGGWIGFLKAKSRPSLIAGHISGAIILIAMFLIFTEKGTKAGCILATATALALSIFFGKRFAKSRKFMPGGLMAVVSAGVFLLFLLANPCG